MIKSIKKGWITVQQLVNQVTGRSQGIILMVLGAGAGAMLGLLTGGAIASMDVSEKQDFIDDNQGQKQFVYTAIEFPDVCDIEGTAFATKGPNGDYTLYVRKDGEFEAQTGRQAYRFAKDFDNCMDELLDDPDEMEEGTIHLRYEVSQPLRTVDSNDVTKTENFRETYATDDSETVSLDVWDGYLSEHEDGAVGALRMLWEDALDDFKVADIYDHVNDADIATMTYQDSYYDGFNGNIPLLFAGIFSVMGFVSFGFSNYLNSQAQARADFLAEKKRGIDKMNVNF